MVKEIRFTEQYSNGKITFHPDQLVKWAKIYGIVGHHSAIEICSWTKKSLLNKGECYKHKFYGVDTHRCAQISPAAAWCQESCIFCWRPMEFYSKIKLKPSEVDKPNEIINGVVEKRRKLLSGFKGNKNVDLHKFHEAYDLFPSHWAISLSGEPTIYPLLGELINKLKTYKEVRSIFVVSNGQEPNVFRKWQENKQLPTQLYISLSAWNKSSFKSINRSMYEDGWERLLETLTDVLPSLDCRRVVRLTLIKGVNDMYLKEYARILENTNTDYIEVKSYMHLGQSRQRLKESNMLFHDEVLERAEKLLSFLDDFEYHNEQRESRIVLLKNRNSPYEDYINNVNSSYQKKK